MREDRGFLRWCLSQTRGLRLVKPSQNLVKGYVEKSRSALRSMSVNAKAGIIEWAVSASYYAKYFSVYALLSKVGVRCEIHDCTIAVFQYLFGGVVSRNLVQEFRRSKEDRIETQYYTREVRVDLSQLMRKTRNFVLDIEKIADGLSPARIAILQNSLKDLRKT